MSDPAATASELPPAETEPTPSDDQPVAGGHDEDEPAQGEGVADSQ